MTTSQILMALAAAAVLAFAWHRLSRRRQKPDPRRQVMADLLDAADALESRLRMAREEIQAVAGEQDEDPVGAALHEMLRQRVWLRDYGDDASIEQLNEVRGSIEQARQRIDGQLRQVERARLAEPS